MIIKYNKLNIIDNGIKIEKLVYNNNIENIYVVIGCLDTPAGLKILKELLSWCSKIYKYIFVVHQKAPGKLFEYPALKYAESLAKKSDKHILYLHTKGASYNTNDYIGSQKAQIVRLLWKYCFYINYKNNIKNNLNNNIEVIAPFISNYNKNKYKNNITWFNGFIMTNNIWRDMNIQIDDDRLRYEGILNYWYLKDENKIIKKSIFDDTVPKNNNDFNQISQSQNHKKIIEEDLSYDLYNFILNEYNINLMQYI